MCDFGSTGATLSNAQRAHDLAMQCIANLALTRGDDLQLISDEYLKKYLFFWDALNEFVRKQSSEIAHEHTHDDGHTHSHTHDDSHTHSHTHADGHTHTHTHTHEDGHTHSHTHDHPHS